MWLGEVRARSGGKWQMRLTFRSKKRIVASDFFGSFSNILQKEALLESSAAGTAEGGMEGGRVTKR